MKTLCWTLLLLILSPRVCGSYSVKGSPERVVVPLGGDALLPCHLHPAFDVRSLTVLWEFNGTQVYSYRSKSPSSDVDARFMNRTSLNDTDMSSGNISLTLHNVTEEDEGMYTCIVPRRFKATVTLVVVRKNGTREGIKNETREVGKNGTREVGKNGTREDPSKIHAGRRRRAGRNQRNNEDDVELGPLNPQNIVQNMVQNMIQNDV